MKQSNQYPANIRFRQMAGAAMVAILLILPGAAPAAGDDSALCDQATRDEERHHNIPSRLLYAIATTESGRWDPETQENFAWPWTVMAQGEGKFYPDRQSAIQAVEALRRAGVTNIDIGCMQINMGYHPDAFDSLHEAFEPASNVAYAATFLNELRLSRRSWSRAVRFYHSSDAERQAYYGKKVYSAWRDIRARDRRIQLAKNRQLAEARQAQRIASRNNAESANNAVPSPPSALPQNIVWPPRSYRAWQQVARDARARAFSPR
ncbi:MAG: transglycosylase SLT domain-containing protein [Alphaproteobacteria bacterium]